MHSVPRLMRSRLLLCVLGVHLAAADTTVHSRAWAGNARSASWWHGTKGIGFSAQNGATSGAYFGNRARHADALRRVVEQGFNLIRTWNFRGDAHDQMLFELIREMNAGLPERRKLLVQVGLWIMRPRNDLIDRAFAQLQRHKDVVIGVALGSAPPCPLHTTTSGSIP